MICNENEWKMKLICGWKTIHKYLLIVPVLLICISICTSAQAQNAQDGYVQKKLVSDMPGIARTTDRNLINSWGIARNPTGPWWVNDNGTGVSTLYNGNGDLFPLNTPLVVMIPPPEGATGTSTPTGIVFNGTKDFEVSTNKPARFIFVTEDGTISGWNPDVNQSNAVLKADNSKSGAVYKGAALGLANGVPYLYAADFHNGTVDVFDTDFKKVTLPDGAFTNPSIQAGFAPFNVANVDGRIFVTYAKQGANKKDDVAGPGNGFVDVFTPDGKLLMSLKRGSWLNSPWGVVLTPANFGKLSNMILVGNFGSGQIAAYDLNGNFQGMMKGTDGKSITIDGLWGLGFGNGQNAGPRTTLFFAAGPNDEKNGLFGTLTTGR